MKVKLVDYVGKRLIDYVVFRFEQFVDYAESLARVLLPNNHSNSGSRTVLPSFEQCG